MFESLAKADFVPSLDSPRRARQFVTSVLVDCPAALVETVALVTSELATNAVAHTGAPFSVEVLRGLHALRIEVTDPLDRLPVIQAISLSRGGGRGLVIV